MNEPYFRTFTNKKIYPNHLEDMEVDIIDIAHSLSIVNRYNGHLDRAYSVGNHSLIVEHILPGLPSLLHDAGEAYLPDFPSPWKACYPELFKEMEDRLDKVVFAHFNIPWPISPEIKEVDRKLRADEMFFLSSWPENTISYSFTHNIIPMLTRGVTPKQIEQEFLDRYTELVG